MNFMTNVGLKMVDKEGEIPESGHTKFHREMIKNILSLNDPTKKYRVTFN